MAIRLDLLIKQVNLARELVPERLGFSPDGMYPIVLAEIVRDSESRGHEGIRGILAALRDRCTTPTMYILALKQICQKIYG